MMKPLDYTTFPLYNPNVIPPSSLHFGLSPKEIGRCWWRSTLLSPKRCQYKFPKTVQEMEAAPYRARQPDWLQNARRPLGQPMWAIPKEQYTFHSLLEHAAREFWENKCPLPEVSRFETVLVPDRSEPIEDQSHVYLLPGVSDLGLPDIVLQTSIPHPRLQAYVSRFGFFVYYKKWDRELENYAWTFMPWQSPHDRDNPVTVLDENGNRTKATLLQILLDVAPLAGWPDLDPDGLACPALSMPLGWEAWDLPHPHSHTQDGDTPSAPPTLPPVTPPVEPDEPTGSGSHLPPSQVIRIRTEYDALALQGLSSRKLFAALKARLLPIDNTLPYHTLRRICLRETYQGPEYEPPKGPALNINESEL